MIDVFDTTLYVKKTGTGKPLIFVHGNGEDHTIFDVLVSRLKDHYTCYQIDSRNHGRSKITDIFSYEQMAEDTKELIKILKLERPHFLGFSDGAIIGLILAMKYPTTLDHMMICGANLHPRGLKKQVRNHMIQTYKETKSPWINMMIEQPNISFRRLHQAKIPVLVVAGEKDVISYRHTLAIARNLPLSSYIILKEKHHDDYIVNRDDLTELCLSFFIKN